MWPWATQHPYLFFLLGLFTPVTLGLIILVCFSGALKVIEARRAGKNIFESMLDLTRYADAKKKEEASK